LRYEDDEKPKGTWRENGYVKEDDGQLIVFIVANNCNFDKFIYIGNFRVKVRKKCN